MHEQMFLENNVLLCVNNVPKLVTQMGEAEKQMFLLGSALGSPGALQVTEMELGRVMTSMRA